MNTYKTSDIAKKIGIHPNTVRLYEELELIPKPDRKKNGYRIFTDFHIEQMKLLRTAFEVEVLQKGLRKQIITILKASARGDFERAIRLTEAYLHQIGMEQKNAEEAIEITVKLLSGEIQVENAMVLTRKQAAEYLKISIDTIRNWEMNGLIAVKRKQNGYRIYTEDDIRQLKIIRALRSANYSLSAILRMQKMLSQNPEGDIRHMVDTPSENDDVISVCDKLITSLHRAEKNAEIMLRHLIEMKNQFN